MKRRNGSEPTDKADVEALRRQIAELQAEVAAARQVRRKPANRVSKIDTSGGTAIQGGVKTYGGHFIGRDFVQVIDQGYSRDDERQEARSIIAHYLDALVRDLAGLKLTAIDSSAAQPHKEVLKLADVYVPLNTTLLIPETLELVNWLKREALGKNFLYIDANSTKIHFRSPAERRTEFVLSNFAPEIELANQRITRRGRVISRGRVIPREILDRLEREKGSFGLPRQVSALEALNAHNKLTILGKPGSGKSTFGASVLLSLAQVWQGQAREVATLGRDWSHGALLPIRVVLRRFAEQLPSGKKPARAGDLWDFIARDLKDAGYGLSSRVVHLIQNIARDHGALMLLDGLDECGSSETRRRVLAAVEEIQSSAGQRCRFLLTARPYAWPEGLDPIQGVYALADLDDDQVEHFVRAWYQALVRRNWISQSDAKRKLDDLLDVMQRPDLLPLTRNPLLLTLMVTLHTNRGRLPDDRADLYHESVELLMQRWNEQVGADRALLDALNVPGLKLSALREALQQLAFEIHKEHVGREGTADIPEHRLEKAFQLLLNNSKDKAAVVVDYIEKRAGLLIGQGERSGERQFTFPHRTFQEFLAACYLADQGKLNDIAVGLIKQDPTWEGAGHWREVLVLAARRANTDRGTALADAMIGSELCEQAVAVTAKTVDFICAQIEAEQLLEIGLPNLAVNKPRDMVRKRVASWLVEGIRAFKEIPEPARRSYLGNLAARLGDPRFDPQRFYLPADKMMGFVRIPADSQFRAGTRTNDAARVAKITGYSIPEHEINDVLTPTPDFYIASYPVTVAQFRAFVESSGYGGYKVLNFPIGNYDSHPMGLVTWNEALQYCNWLNQFLLNSPSVSDTKIGKLLRELGWCITLPSETEWEKAARGGLNDAVFSWGNEPDPSHANFDLAETIETTRLDVFRRMGSG